MKHKRLLIADMTRLLCQFLLAFRVVQPWSKGVAYLTMVHWMVCPKTWKAGLKLTLLTHNQEKASMRKI